MSADYEVGPQYGATGSHNNAARVGISGAGIVSDAHAHYFEANRIGISATGGGLMSASTAVAGVAPGTVLSTTPPFALWNPPNSGVIVSIATTRLGYVSGTLGAGSIVYALVEAQISKPTTGTALAVTPANIGNQSQGRALAFQGSTLLSTPLILSPAYALGAALATTATFPAQIKDNVDGEFLVLPGGVFVMQGVAAAGTSPLVLFGATWEEIPLLN